MANPAGQGPGNSALNQRAAAAGMQRPATASIVIPCYRDADRAIALVAALRRQRSDDHHEPQIIVVDDGSEDGSAERIAHALSGMATVISLASNVGRAAARNAGARVANGEVILFMDCDCHPVGADLLECHLAVWKDDTVASAGAVRGSGNGFWARYQQATAKRMAGRVAAGEAFAATAANLMVGRHAFFACDGFDPAYRGYGFEDRDLLLRLLDHGRIVWSDDAVVTHVAETRMSTVTAKLAEAGQTTAPLFRTRHPHAYRRLSYANMDATLHPWLRPVGQWIGPCVMQGARYADGLLQARWIPYRLRVMCMRVMSALAFLYGTTREPADPS